MPEWLLCDGTGEAKGSYPMSKEWPGGVTPCPGSGAAAERSYPTFKVRSSSCALLGEEKLHVQGKRNPSKTVGAERRHQKVDRLRQQSQTTSQSGHMDHMLSNSMTLSHAKWGHPRWTDHGGEV